MWSYYGSKSKVVHRYPAPKFDKIIEPFAGSARYALRYFDRDVLLVDKYDVIVKIWQWLQQASEKDIMSLPRIESGQSIDNFSICDEAKMLIGFCINRGSAQPKKTAKDFNTWNSQKSIIAGSLYKIRHWKIRQGEYEGIENETATYFVDPPYQVGGEWYVKSNKDIDFQSLASWCKSRNGHTIVCENTKADWLPFVPLERMTGSMYTTTEAVWSNYHVPYQLELFAPSNNALHADQGKSTPAGEAIRYISENCS